MPPRDPELPEGTDQIINGAAAEGGGGSSGGFVARGGGNGTGTTEKLVSQVRDQVTNLRGQAGDKLRSVADDGKSRATTLLDDVAGIIQEAARSIDERFGEDYGGYAHRASDAVSGFAGRVRDKSVDDLLDDTRDIVRRSPAVAVAAAAVVGFALMRVVRTGMEQAGGNGGKNGGGRGRSGGAKARSRNADTTTGGGA
jgi:ElaB/YqjD/DUF883 family membrane-anchored ribosome-binding protein